MAPKNLESIERRTQEEERRTHADKEQSDFHSDSGEGGTKKQPVENGSVWSSPSAIVPYQKKKTPQVFSDDDVIWLLNRLALFWADGKNSKWAEFHEFVKHHLSKEFTRTQISEKIRSLKNKFERNRANGGRIHPSDPHEAYVFELSKALWGDEEGSKKRKQELLEERDAANTILSIGKLVDKKKARQVDEGNHQKEREIRLDDFQSAYPLLYASFNMFGYPKVAMEECVLIGRENAQELEEQWRELNAQVHRLELKKLAFQPK